MQQNYNDGREARAADPREGGGVAERGSMAVEMSMTELRAKVANAQHAHVEAKRELQSLQQSAQESSRELMEKQESRCWRYKLRTTKSRS